MIPALLVIDLQQFYFKRAVFSTPVGEKSLTRLVYNTNELIDFFFVRELPIVHIRTVHKQDGSTRDLWMKRNNRWSLGGGVGRCPRAHFGAPLSIGH